MFPQKCLMEGDAHKNGFMIKLHRESCICFPVLEIHNSYLPVKFLKGSTKTIYLTLFSLAVLQSMWLWSWFFI